MQIEVNVIEMKGKKGLVKTGTETVETLAEGRHSMMCNLCGNPDYPGCRSWCESKKQDK